MTTFLKKTTAQTPTKLHYDEFENLLQYIVENEGLSATLSWNLKRNKGWTWRQSYYGNPVEIDFWTDNAKSMFLLSYSHLLLKSLKFFKKNND